MQLHNSIAASFQTPRAPHHPAAMPSGLWKYFCVYFGSPSDTDNPRASACISRDTPLRFYEMKKSQDKGKGNVYQPGDLIGYVKRVSVGPNHPSLPAYEFHSPDPTVYLINGRGDADQRRNSRYNGGMAD